MCVLGGNLVWKGEISQGVGAWWRGGVRPGPTSSWFGSRGGSSEEPSLHQVLTFLPRSKRPLISWLQSPSVVILEPRKIKSDTVSTVSPSISHEDRFLVSMRGRAGGCARVTAGSKRPHLSVLTEEEACGESSPHTGSFLVYFALAAARPRASLSKSV